MVWPATFHRILGHGGVDVRRVDGCHGCLYSCSVALAGMVGAGQTGGADAVAGLCDVVFNNDCTPLNQASSPELSEPENALLILNPKIRSRFN